MVSVHTDNSTLSVGLGKKRLQLAQQTTFAMMNSFRVDFSGQENALREQINSAGRLVRSKNTISVSP